MRAFLTYGLELRARCPGMEDAADLGTVSNELELVMRSFDVGDDQVEALG
jgi:hypothetical protein